MANWQVHRFGDHAALTSGNGGGCVYMTAQEARRMANTLLNISRSIKEERFTDARNLTGCGDSIMPDRENVALATLGRSASGKLTGIETYRRFGVPCRTGQPRVIRCIVRTDTPFLTFADDRPGDHPTTERYAIIGTAYGWLHDKAGDIRFWNTESGARSHLRRNKGYI